MLIVGIVVLFVGIVLLICGPIGKKKNDRCSAEAQGVLRKIYETSDSDGITGHGYIFSYYVGDVEYTLNSTTASKEADRVGDACTIWYNPEKPQEAQCFHYGDSDKTFVIIRRVGLAALPLGLVLTFVGCAQQFAS